MSIVDGVYGMEFQCEGCRLIFIYDAKVSLLKIPVHHPSSLGKSRNDANILQRISLILNFEFEVLSEKRFYSKSINAHEQLGIQIVPRSILETIVTIFQNFCRKMAII